MDKKLCLVDEVISTKQMQGIFEILRENLQKV